LNKVERNMRDIDRVHLEAFIHPVKLGCKPASEVDCHHKDLGEVLDIITERGLLYTVKNQGPEYPENYQIHAFAKPHLKHVIEHAPVFDDPVVEHWYWGKLYGYSEEAIASYTDKFCLVALGARRQGVRAVVKTDDLATVETLVPPDARLLSGCWHVFHLLFGVIRGVFRAYEQANAGMDLVARTLKNTGPRAGGQSE